LTPQRETRPNTNLLTQRPRQEPVNIKDMKSQLAIVREKMNTQATRRRITRNPEFGAGSVDNKIINASNMFYTSGALQGQKAVFSSRGHSVERDTRAETRSNMTGSRAISDRPLMQRNNKSLDYRLEVSDMIEANE
jgi:hypothetical protein